MTPWRPGCGRELLGLLFGEPSLGRRRLNTADRVFDRVPQLVRPYYASKGAAPWLSAAPA